MHKQTVEAIKLALTQELRKNFITFRIGRKDTAGFWSMRVITQDHYNHLIPHIKNIGMAIGRYYGEELWCTKTKKSIHFT